MSDESQGISYIFLAFIIIFSVLLATGVSYFMLFQVANIGGEGGEVEVAEGQKEELGPTTSLEGFTVNLAGDRSFAQVSIVLEVSSNDVSDEITDRSPQIRDTIISILRRQAMSDLEEEDGMRQLREDIRDEINSILMEGRVTNVFFTEFVVQ